MFQKLNSSLVTLISIVWIGTIMVFYFNRHPEHWLGIHFFKFWGLLVSVGMIYGLWILVDNLLFKKLKKRWPLNGIGIVGLVLIFSCFAHGFYQNVNGFTLGFSNYIVLLGNISSVITTSFLFFFISYLMGERIWPYFMETEKEFLLLKICLGCLIVFIGLFVLASFQISTFWPVAIYFVVLTCISYDLILPSLQKILLTPIEIASNSKTGLLLCFVLILYLTINLNYFYGPFPLGYDSRNLYFNIPRLIFESGGLVDGFAPYNWSLIMSLGFILFESPELTLMLSFAPAILICLYIIHISKEYFKINSNIAVLLAIAFIVTPAVTNHLTVELKIDFGLLLIQMAIFELMILVWNRQNIKSVSSEAKLFILIGLLSGFAMTIKFTHTFLVFTFLILIWARRFGLLGILTMFSACSFVTLLLRLDDMSGLRKFNLGADFMLYTYLTVTIVFFIAMVYLFRSKVLNLVKLTLLFTLGNVFFLGMWLTNADSFKPNDLKSNLLGGQDADNISILELIDNYKEKEKNDKLEE